MHIVNSMAANFGKYDLDVSAVGMRSISETDIKLPYTGLLDGFFKQNQDATGLAQYWLGVWQAHYTEWRKIVTGPDRLLTILSSLSVTDREFLCKHMMDVPATE